MMVVVSLSYITRGANIAIERVHAAPTPRACTHMYPGYEQAFEAREALAVRSHTVHTRLLPSKTTLKAALG